MPFSCPPPGVAARAVDVALEHAEGVALDADAALAQVKVLLGRVHGVGVAPVAGLRVAHRLVDDAVLEGRVAHVALHLVERHVVLVQASVRVFGLQDLALVVALDALLGRDVAVARDHEPVARGAFEPAGDVLAVLELDAVDGKHLLHLCVARLAQPLRVIVGRLVEVALEAHSFGHREVLALHDL